jgi:hypothetical protein
MKSHLSFDRSAFRASAHSAVLPFRTVLAGLGIPRAADIPSLHTGVNEVLMMKRTCSRVFCVSLLAAALPVFAAAQQPSNAPQQTDRQQKDAKPATSPAPATPTASTPAKPKKVWTNDDVGSLKDGVSVVGEKNKSSASSYDPYAARNGNKEYQAQRLRQQRARLQAQLDAADKKIQDLRDFKADNSSPSGGINPHHGYSMTPVSDQIQQLEEKKKQIQAQIDAVDDAARKQGIEPGELR